MICFENVTYAYPGEKPVLKDLSFTISKGERVGLIGANGAGKSTVMKAALGLVNCEGKISIDGMEMCRRNLSAIRKCVTVDDEKVTDIGKTYSADELKNGIVVRRGKKNFNKVILK